MEIEKFNPSTFNRAVKTFGHTYTKNPNCSTAWNDEETVHKEFMMLQEMCDDTRRNFPESQHNFAIVK
jgi:hypothetical protein